MSAMLWIGQAKAHMAVPLLAVSVVLANAVPALASSHSANDNAKENHDEIGAISALYNRCVVLSRTPHWTNPG